MNTPLSSLLGAGVRAAGEGREYKAYPNLRNARWLLPAGQATVARSGMNGLFQPSSLKGHVLKRLITLGAIRGERLFLDEEAVSRLESKLAQTFGEPKPRVAFYIGVPGAYRKVTAQVMSAEGEILAFAKIATSPLAAADVEAEHRTLTRLSWSADLRGRVPRALHYFEWQSSRVLLMTGGPKRRGPAGLSQMHLKFCRDVFLSFTRQSVFAESSMSVRMQEKLLRLEPHLPPDKFAVFGRALDLLREELGPALLPLSLAHRDFAPWNTRVGQQGLFVFDWDRADEATPLYDVFHFQAIQAILLNRRDHLPDRRLLRIVLKDLWPDGGGSLPWLYLAYLLDMSLVYNEARIVAPDIGDDRVSNWFSERIEDFFRHVPPL